MKPSIAVRDHCLRTLTLQEMCWTSGPKRKRYKMIGMCLVYFPFPYSGVHLSFLIEFLISFHFWLPYSLPREYVWSSAMHGCLSPKPPKPPSTWLLSDASFPSFFSKLFALHSFVWACHRLIKKKKPTVIWALVLWIVFIGVIRRELEVEKNKATILTGYLQCSLRSRSVLPEPHAMADTKLNTLPNVAYQTHCKNLWFRKLH